MAPYKRKYNTNNTINKDNVTSIHKIPTNYISLKDSEREFGVSVLVNVIFKLTSVYAGKLQ